MSDGSSHPGCDHCYAEAMSRRNEKTLGKWGPEGSRVLSKSFWTKCRKWNADAKKRGVIESVFPSICDPFEKWDGPILASNGEFIFHCCQCGFKGQGKFQGDPTKPATRCPRFNEGCMALDNDILATMADVRRDLFSLIDECQNLRFPLLTKRPQNVPEMWPTADDGHGGKLAAMLFGEESEDGMSIVPAKGKLIKRRENVAIIASVSDQQTADEMVPHLLKCRDLVPWLGVSAEPLLGEINLSRLNNGGGEKYNALTAEVSTYGGNKFKASDARPLDLCIIGGESGPHSRPCNVEWIRSLVRQCRDAGVSCFVKQLGSNSVIQRSCSTMQIYMHDKKGGDVTEWPADLQVRQLPWEGVK